MTAAYYLRKQGHDVTIKEALPSVGGMMAYGILHIGFENYYTGGSKSNNGSGC